jgi:hypothetical protein
MPRVECSFRHNSILVQSRRVALRSVHSSKRRGSLEELEGQNLVGWKDVLCAFGGSSGAHNANYNNCALK